ncbi:MAG: COX15/CtaA family protein [Bacteroidetes bacterium]|nr:COX15/CtaA family protein [Bacteroidota bacterium]
MRAVKIWLWVGVFMVFIQVLIGGITRLTGSGLSITEWSVIMGAVPPTNAAQWNDAFEQYKQFPQYQLVNQHFTLSEFKNIFGGNIYIAIGHDLSGWFFYFHVFGFGLEKQLIAHGKINYGLFFYWVACKD